MKFSPFDTILSGKSKKNKKIAEEKPYFENTNDNLGLYKNPSLNPDADSDGETEEDRPKGKALLKKIYGGACWKGYEQFGMKEKKGRKVPNCVPVGAGSKSIKSELGDVSKNYKQVISHLQEHQAEGVGDPKDKKQSGVLKGDLKRVNALSFTPANKVARKDPLYKVSNPKSVQKRAFEIYGKDAIIYKSTNPKKKYQIQDPNGKWVRFGDAKMEDYNKHLDPVRRKSYLARALGIRGKWRDNPYSPNYLAILLLW